MIKIDADTTGGMRIARQAAGISPSKIRSIFNLALGMEDVVNFGIGEPDFDTPECILDAAKEGLDSGFTHYTANAGLLELRTLTAEKLRRSNGIETDPEGRKVRRGIEFEGRREGGRVLLIGAVNGVEDQRTILNASA